MMEENTATQSSSSQDLVPSISLAEVSRQGHKAKGQLCVYVCSVDTAKQKKERLNKSEANYPTDLWVTDGTAATRAVFFGSAIETLGFLKATQVITITNWRVNKRHPSQQEKVPACRMEWELDLTKAKVKVVEDMVLWLPMNAIAQVSPFNQPRACFLARVEEFGQIQEVISGGKELSVMELTVKDVSGTTHTINIWEDLAKELEGRQQELVGQYLGIENGFIRQRDGECSITLKENVTPAPTYYFLDPNSQDLQQAWSSLEDLLRVGIKPCPVQPTPPKSPSISNPKPLPASESTTGKKRKGEDQNEDENDMEALRQKNKRLREALAEKDKQIQYLFRQLMQKEPAL